MIMKKSTLVHTMHKFFWGVGVGLLAGIAFVLLYILLMYRSTDSSLFYTNSAHIVSWWAWGDASVAALLFYVCGVAAWLVPFFVGYGAWCTYQKYSFSDERLRLCCWAMLWCAISLCGALSAGVQWHDRVLFGGVFGSGLRFLVISFDSTVVHVSLLLIIGLCFVLITRLAFVKPVWHGLCVMGAWVQKYKISHKIFVGLRLGVSGVVRVITWCILVPKKIIVPARACEQHGCAHRGDDSSIEAIVHDAFWHSYKTAGVSESPTETPVKTAREKKYMIPVDELFVRQVLDKKESEQISSVQDARVLEEKLAHFGVHGQVRAVKRGPVVTCFEYEPAVDTKLSKITALADDLLLALQALSLRIIAPIPGTNVVGFEVARTERQTVSYAQLMHTTEVPKNNNLPLILGADVVGNPVVIDLVRMPHILMAGSTGSGKSVALHSMILSLIMHKSPEELKLILIDPKRLELRVYEGIGHMLFPVIVEVSQAIQVLNWVVNTMHERYECMARAEVRNIAQYHALPDYHEREPMPYVVVVIDELADLMLAAGNQLELLIVRIAQMARAAGIHLIVATQRPSVDVITGLIKVNFVSRIALRVSSATDSRVILDEDGAQRLVGAGDMLMRDGNGILKRVHGAYCTSDDIQRVVTYIKEHVSGFLPQSLTFESHVQPEPSDSLYKEVLVFLQNTDEVSISLLQRRFRIGFNRSARIIDMLESEGRIVNASGGKTRKVVRSQ